MRGVAGHRERNSGPPVALEDQIVTAYHDMVSYHRNGDRHVSIARLRNVLLVPAEAFEQAMDDIACRPNVTLEAIGETYKEPTSSEVDGVVYVGGRPRVYMLID